jgi:hypothetical protein
MATSVGVGALHVERVRTVEPEDDSILIVHSHGVQAPPITRERVQAISRWHSEVFDLTHSVDLVQLPLYDWPQVVWNASGSLRVDAGPDVPGRVVGEPANHSIAL